MTTRNTPTGVGMVGADDSRDSANASVGIGAGLVVHEERVLAHVGDVDDLALAELVEHDAVLVVVAEPDRLAVLQLDEHVGARLSFAVIPSNAPSLKTLQFW